MCRTETALVWNVWIDISPHQSRLSTVCSRISEVDGGRWRRFMPFNDLAGCLWGGGTTGGKRRGHMAALLIANCSWTDHCRNCHWQGDSYPYGSATGPFALMHFTQVVWKDTRQLGCARTSCNGLGDFYVCQYYPPGELPIQLTAAADVGRVTTVLCIGHNGCHSCIVTAGRMLQLKQPTAQFCHPPTICVLPQLCRCACHMWH
jgi:hypothetical protein